MSETRPKRAQVPNVPERAHARHHDYAALPGRARDRVRGRRERHRRRTHARVKVPPDPRPLADRAVDARLQLSDERLGAGGKTVRDRRHDPL